MADADIEKDAGLEASHAEKDGDDLQMFNNFSDQTVAASDVSGNIVPDASVIMSQNNVEVVEEDSSLTLRNAEERDIVSRMFDHSVQTDAMMTMSGNSMADALDDMPENSSVDSDISVNVSLITDMDETEVDMVGAYVDIQQDSSLTLRNAEERDIVSGMFDHSVQTDAMMTMSGNSMADALDDMPENSSVDTDTSVNVPLIIDMDETDVDIDRRGERHAISGNNIKANASVDMLENNATDTSFNMPQNVETDTTDMGIAEDSSLVTRIADSVADSGTFNLTEETVDGLQNSRPPDTVSVVDVEPSASHVPSDTQTDADVGGITASECQMEGVIEIADFDDSGMTDVCKELIAESIGHQTLTGMILCMCRQTVSWIKCILVILCTYFALESS